LSPGETAACVRAAECAAAACVAIARVGRSGDGEISGKGTTNMCGWCCGRRDARTALPQRRRALFASTPGRSNEIPQLSVATSRSRGGSQQPCKQPCRRAASCKGSLHNGRESEFTADTSAEPYGTCATERATQRSPLGTQQGALPYVGPEPRPTAASSRRNEQGRATTGVPSANKVEPSWAHHTRSTDAAIRAGAVVHEASRIPPPIV